MPRGFAPPLRIPPGSRATAVTRPLARLERAREALLEPEHLRAGAEAEAEGGDRGRSVEPTAARRRRDHVPPAVDDVEVDSVATSRLPDSRRHRCARHGLR